MKSVLSGWESLCASSGALRFVDINLRGIGQVMFQDNPLSGALFLAAIAWGSFAAGVPQVLFGGLLAVVAATLTAQWLRVDQASLRAGLYGFNGFLVGLALATFVAPGPLLWAYVILGAAVSVVAMSATANVARTWGMPALTFPFVLVTWLLLLATYGFAGLAGTALPAAGVVAPFESVAATRLDAGAVRAGDAAQHFAGVPEGQRHRGTALPGRACRQLASRRRSRRSAGAILAVVTAHLLGAESDLVTGGLLGFSPVLTAVALGTVFNRPGLRVAAYAALGTVFTVVAQAAFNVALTPLAIPALTAPFVLVTWMFLLPRLVFDEAAADPARAMTPGARPRSGRYRVRVRRPARAAPPSVRGFAALAPDGDDDRHQHRGDEPGREAVVVEVEPRVQRTDAQRRRRMHESRHDAPVPAEAAGDGRQRRAEQRRQQDRRVGRVPRLEQRTQEHAEHDRHDVPRMLAERREADDGQDRADDGPVEVAADRSTYSVPTAPVSPMLASVGPKPASAMKSVGAWPASATICFSRDGSARSK